MRTLSPVEAEIYDELADERDRQRTLWGNQTESPWGWLAILVEEVGEVAKEVNENASSKNNAEASFSSRMEDELIQVAAVCVAWLDDVRRNRG
jgi:NTP pyrophosphatase (non-canonical NTP hydrolase)